MNNKYLTKAIDQTLRNLVDVETSVPTILNTLFSKTIKDEFDERKPYSKASQRIHNFASSYIIPRIHRI